MNYLAHSVISLEIDEKTNKNTLYGNFTGDFYKGRIEKIDLQENLKSGIILHRLIDKISDRKENFLNFCKKNLEFLKGLYRICMLIIFCAKILRIFLVEILILGM